MNVTVCVLGSVTGSAAHRACQSYVERGAALGGEAVWLMDEIDLAGDELADAHTGPRGHPLVIEGKWSGVVVELFDARHRRHRPHAGPVHDRVEVAAVSGHRTEHADKGSALDPFA